MSVPLWMVRATDCVSPYSWGHRCSCELFLRSPLAVYCKKFVSESVKFSAGLRERERLIDQYVEL
jgi:hypothetical protein